MPDQTFRVEADIPASSRRLFDWHARPGAFERLNPPWDPVELVSHDGIRDGQRAVIRMGSFPVRIRWIAEHRNYRDGEQFQDVQIAGPFARFEHTHTMTPIGPEESRLTDAIEYRLPLSAVSQMLAGWKVRRTLERVFAYRHRRTVADLTFWNHYRESPPMQILITGGTGLIGQELTSLLTTGGHQVRTLTRSQPKSDRQTQWNPDAAEFDPKWFEGADAIIHLAGENIAGKRWSDAFKQKLRTSRVDVTKKLCAALGKLDRKPETLISASAIGWYGDRGDEELDENSPLGTGFLPELCREWEAASQPAGEFGIRVVNPRIGIVLSPRGGALQKMLTPFKMCVGGVIGSGRQWMSWLGIDDIAGALVHALLTPSLAGPVNLVSPKPLTNREFTKTLGSVISRPTVFPMPAFAARLAFGEMADALLVGGAKVLPGKLLTSGYEFRYPDLEGCLQHLLGRTPVATGKR